MRTPFQAMMWELWRTGRLEITGRLLASCALVLWLCAFSDAQFASAERSVLRAAVILMLVSSSAFSYTWSKALENRTTGFTFRLGFVRPISTTTLVLVPTLFCAVVAVVCFVVPAALFCALTEMSLPLLGGAVGVACMVTCFAASVWAPTTIVGKWIALALVGLSILVLFLVFHAQHDDPDPWVLALGKPGYFEFSWYYYVGCLAVSGFAIVVTVAAVDRQRHGEGWFDRPLFGSSWLRRSLLPTAAAGAIDPSVRGSFSNQTAAQCWYEARRTAGKVLPFSVVAPLFPLAFVCIGPWLYGEAMPWEDAPFVWLAALAVCPAAYQLVGADAALGLRHKQGSTQLSVFDAAQAISNDQLITIKLLVIATCVVAGWLCMAATAATHTTLAGTWYVWARIGTSISDAVGGLTIGWWVAGVSCLLLHFITGTSFFVALGYWIPKYQIRFFVGVVAVLFHAALAVWDSSRGWQLSLLWMAYGYMLALTIITLCFFILRRAFVSGYLGTPLFIVASFLWGICTILTVAFCLKAAPAMVNRIDVPLPVLAILISLLLAPLASAAVAPLALASHRHA